MFENLRLISGSSDAETDEMDGYGDVEHFSSLFAYRMTDIPNVLSTILKNCEVYGRQVRQLSDVTTMWYP